MSDPAQDRASGRATTAIRLTVGLFLVCAGYFIGGIVGIALRFPPSGIATIWTPTAILLAALLVTPPRTWWAYLVAAVPTHVLLVMLYQPEVPLLVMFVQVGSNDLHAVLAALGVRKLVGLRLRFDSFKGVAAYILYAAIASTLVVCALAVAAFVLTGWATDFWLAFRQRVLANVFAIMTIPPLVVVTAAGELVAARDRRWTRYGELGLLTMALVVVDLTVFGRAAPASANLPALLLAPLPLLLWAAVRLGPGALCWCLLVLAGLSLSNAFGGRGPFVTASPAENTLSLQIFLLAISAPLILVAALVQERQRAEDEARREREQLAHVLRIATLGEFTASFAHEISQPLTAITTNADTARRLLGDPPVGGAQVQQALADIEHAARRASRVIHRLRALFQKEHEERVAVDANGLVDEILGLLRSEIEQRRIAVRFARGEALPAVLGDPVQLQQVVLNLVVNACEAIDATPAGPRAIVIETSRVDGAVAIAIRDTGVGVKGSELERIFEHFVSSKPQGLGMGLAISRSIIEAHGGRLWATANVDLGLTLHVDLPVGRERVTAKTWAH